MSDPKVDALARVPLFSHCSRRGLEFLASEADEVEQPADVNLITQGVRSDTFFVLLEGEVEVDVDGHPRRSFSAGDFFGEISMLDRGPSLATVVTTTAVRLMVMSHAQFRDAIMADDGLMAEVLAAMGQRLRALSSARPPTA